MVFRVGRVDRQSLGSKADVIRTGRFPLLRAMECAGIRAIGAAAGMASRIGLARQTGVSDGTQSS
jgi:hypothetical protein